MGKEVNRVVRYREKESNMTIVGILVVIILVLLAIYLFQRVF